MNIHMRPMRPDEQPFCESVLRALPDWFGIESSLVQYVRDTIVKPTWISEYSGESAGFITIHRHTPRAAEIHCMAVLPQHHRCGVGSAMLRHIDEHLRSDGVEYLQVKTQGPSRPCQHYDQTRMFYESLGFVPLEEFPNLWPGNPCLLLVRKIT